MTLEDFDTIMEVIGDQDKIESISTNNANDMYIKSTSNELIINRDDGYIIVKTPTFNMATIFLIENIESIQYSI